MKKIYPLHKIRPDIDDDAHGKSVVLCHGVFDLLHIGHIRHLQQAKALGDILCVTITADRYVNKGPGRPAFNQNMRAEALAALDCVDYIAINDAPTAINAIESIRPSKYAKGRTDEDDPAYQAALEKEIQAVRACGGITVFTDCEVFSSSSLINQHLTDPSESREFLDGIHSKFPLNSILSYIDLMKSRKVLVIGETIVDEYVFGTVMGKANKDPILAMRYGRTEKYAGGAAAIANHVASFCDNVRLLSVIGGQDSEEDFICTKLLPSVRYDFLRKFDSPTIVKRRFIEEYQTVKLFEVYVMKNERLDRDYERQFLEKLRDLVTEFDVVIAADYGHGLFTPEVIALLCEKAKYLAVNAQVNAGNKGFNFISRYPRADYICIDEIEARLDARDRHVSPRDLITSIASRARTRHMMLTMGKNGSLVYDAGHPLSKGPFIYDIPVFGAKIVDRIGAGDAVLAATAPLSQLDVPVEIIGLIGNLVGAEACSVMGNERSVSRDNLMRSIKHLLK